MRKGISNGRTGLVIIALVGVVAFAVTGGSALAAEAAKPAKAAKSKDGNASTEATGAQAGKVAVCHKRKRTIRVSANALPAHARHGDAQRPCSAAELDGGKAKKGKKAKEKEKDDERDDAHRPRSSARGPRPRGDDDPAVELAQLERSVERHGRLVAGDEKRTARRRELAAARQPQLVAPGARPDTRISIGQLPASSFANSASSAVAPPSPRIASVSTGVGSGPPAAR